MQLTVILLASIAAVVIAAPNYIEKRQSTTWQYSCDNKRAPDNFKAFDLGGCNSQLSFNKDRYVGIQWKFDAIYTDGSRVNHNPFQDYNNYGVSDSFYPSLGNNFLTRNPGSTAFTAVHEFTNVCKNGRAPVAWVFYTTSANSACSSSSYRFTTGQIRTTSGVSRPPKVTGTALRRTSDNGDFQVSWDAVPEAAAYSVLVEYPYGTDEVGDPYRQVRGERIQRGTTRAVVPTGTRVQSDARKAIVHCVNSQGVWSFTNDVRFVSASY